MSKGETIPKAKRLAIQSMRGRSTASELAELFQVSERSVVRIWSENATKELAKELRDGTARVNADLEQSGHHHAIYPEMVQMLTVKQYFHLMETREFYRAMRDAYPTNCAWGNLEEKYNRQINELLRVMGAWFGMENQKEPLTSTGVRNNDYTDLDFREMAKVLEDQRRGKTRQPSRACICALEGRAPDHDNGGLGMFSLGGGPKPLGRTSPCPLIPNRGHRNLTPLTRIQEED